MMGLGLIKVFATTDGFRENFLRQNGRNSVLLAESNRKDLIDFYRRTFRMSEQGASREYRELIEYLKQETTPEIKPRGRSSIRDPVKRPVWYASS